VIPYRDEKIMNAVSFFADKHRKKTRKPLYQTALYKYLAFFDFLSLRESGRPALDLVYRAKERGPVPVEIYGNKKDTSKYKFRKDEYGEFVISVGSFDPDYFSPYELEIMERLIEIYAQAWVNTTIMSNSSHSDIKAWRRTWEKKPNSLIDYSLEFDEDLSLKDEENLTYPEEVYLTYRALTS